MTARDPYPYRYCRTPADVECDGLAHYGATWDEDTCRWFPWDARCPHRDHNRWADAMHRGERYPEPAA